MQRTCFAVIGSGPVAREIGRCLVLAGHDAAAVISRSATRASDAASFIGARTASERYEAIPPEVTTILVATADRAIVDTARALGTASVTRGRTLIHFAGSLGASAMRLAETEGASLASIHPLRPFSPENVDPASFAGTFCAVEGDDEAAALSVALVRSIGGQPFMVESEKKILYHASVFLPLTYSITLFAKAVELLRSCGIHPETASNLVATFTDHARRRLAEGPPADALHGPIVHGDVPVVTRFTEAIRTHRPEDAALYAELGLATITLASASNKASARDAEALRELFRAMTDGSR
jgi:predicted short-subunit dehydrogenase-like oxidoreductase (DUF2520 family)